jgi:uncharacterized protein (DUF433 family)
LCNYIDVWQRCDYFLNFNYSEGHHSFMNTQQIVSDPAVMMGKPVIAGTRITVETILEKLAAGETMDQVLAAHLRLTRQAIYAALDFAARALRADVVYPITRKAA